MSPMACTASARLKLIDDLHRVNAASTGLVDDVAGIVDHIGVVASPAKHVVGAGAAIEQGRCRQGPSAR